MRCSSNSSKSMVAPFLGKLFGTVARLPGRRQRWVSGQKKPPGTKEGKPRGPRANVPLGRARRCYREQQAISLPRLFGTRQVSGNRLILLLRNFERGFALPCLFVSR